MAEEKSKIVEIREWIVEHKLRTVGCLWLSGVAGSIAYNWSQPNMKTSVKIIHARYICNCFLGLFCWNRHVFLLFFWVELWLLNLDKVCVEIFLAWGFLRCNNFEGQALMSVICVAWTRDGYVNGYEYRFRKPEF
uniref:HIG1 domain-containing protein n=1 Tax=Kalanchoe fedtschenkoi TaxID=63787 RepID=A0A7N0UY62_KALFE